MNHSFLSVFVVLAASLTLAGCWKQSDVITIKPDGHTTFRSEVIITERGFSYKEIDQLTANFSHSLTQAGWKVEKRWTSKAEPFALVFTGEGNIHKVGSATDFYRIQKINTNTYSIKFVPAEAKGGRSSRRIKFERGSLGGAPRVVDARGNEVKEIQDVLPTERYQLIF